jgi:peptidoglycan/LPS O-acetylase OafA/YrhL
VNSDYKIESGLRPKTIYRPFGTFRFGLALLVLVQHALHLLPEPSRAFLFHMGFGIIAVATFFAISGFIVAEAGTTFYDGRPRAFLLNRVLRLVPPYFAALILAIVGQTYLYSTGKLVPWDYPLSGSPLQPFVLFTGIFDIFPGFQPRYISGQDFQFIPVAWTLRVEFAFYLAACAGFIAMSKRSCIRSHAPYIIFGTGYALYFVFWFSPQHWPQQFGTIPYFIFGICLFQLWRNRTKFNIANLVLAGGCALIGFPFWKQRGDPILLYQMPLLIILFFIFIILAFIPQIKQHWKQFDKALGDLSYPLYLNHYIVLFLLSSLVQNYSLPLYITGIALSLLLAVIMHQLVEAPMRQLRDKVRGVRL